MRKILFFICCTFVCQWAMAQEVDAPDFVQLRQAISNNKSHLYYPRLMERYEKCDSTLSLEDYRALYYGFALREDFVPYQMEKQQLFDIRRKMRQPKADAAVMNEAISITNEILEDNPFDIPAIAVKSIAYLQLGDTLNYNLWRMKQEGILDAITSSGDGDTAESAIYVISVEHEYEVLNRMGLVLESDKTISNKVEYLKVKENPENIEGLYFNFEACRSIYKQKYE